MSNRTSKVAAPLALLAGLSLTHCSADGLGGGDLGNTDCDLAAAAGDANVNANVRLLLQASADFQLTAKNARATILTACGNIATDLGAPNTWAALGDTDRAVSNSDGTGACNAATARIKAIMEASASANFALVVTKGACYPDFAAQAKCDAKCNAEAKCDSGTVETRCEPGELSCKCDTVCKSKSWCRGTVSVEANCHGKCEAMCKGECKGTCTSEGGKRTEGDLNCKGKCSTTCVGKCTGQCQVEAEVGISCGTSVRCKGQCEGSYTEPKCETTFTPPKCVVDASCIAACSASVTSKSICDPPTVELLCDVSVHADLPKLVATVRANLPAVIQAAQTQGKLILDAALRLKAAGQAVVDASSSLNAKSIACAIGGVQVAIQASVTLNVTVQGGTQVSETCSSHAS